jgi:sRNA-binding protein
MNRQFDDVLRTVMLREGWSEEQVNAVSLRGFAKRSMTDLAPDPAAAVEVQRHVYARNCVEELQARIDATREIHEARINAIKGEGSREASDRK